MMRHLMYFTFRSLFVALLAASLFSCGNHSIEAQKSELGEQRRQWEAQMDEAFPENTRDTVELRQRLEYFRKNGNLVGQRAMLRSLGFSARNSSLYGRAIEFHTEALALAYQVVDTVPITNLLNELGTDFRRTGAHEEAIKYHYAALEMAEKYRGGYQGSDTAMVTRNMAAAYNGIGIVYSAMKEQAEALKAHENALRIERGKKNYIGMAMNQSNIGIILLEQGDYDRAMEYFELSLESNEQINNVIGIGLCNFNMGTVYSKQGDHENALAQYLKVYDTLRDLDKSHWVRACLSIGETYLALGNNERAKSYLDEGLAVANEISFPAYITQAHSLLSDYWLAVGEYSLSRDELSRSVAWADTVRNELETSRFMEPRIQYETGRFTRQIAEMDEAARVQVSRQRTMTLMALPFILALIFLSIFLYARRKQSLQNAAELKELERMRSNFFTNITHELRTPITVITGLSNHLLSRANDPEGEEAKDLDAIHRQGGQLMHLVDQLLDFSRSEAGVDKPRWHNGDIVEYIKVIAEPYAQYARSRGMEMIVYSEVQDLAMNFAPSHLRKILGNLLSNAIKHSPQGGRIMVHLRSDVGTRQCRILVGDQGDGIDPENLSKIFELYYTSGTDNQGVASSGIGLALTKQLVEELGGRIAVDSTQGKGAEFTVSLPISNMPIPEDEREVWNEEHSHILPKEADENLELQTEETDDRKSILIVEDNRDVAHYIATVIGGEYSLMHALNGVEGLQMAEEHIPDLIITDVMMPEKDGYAFTADVRASVAVSHIPIIMLTAKVTDEDRIEGIKTGADAYLGKPFNEQELVAQIRQLLESRARLMAVYSGAVLGGGFENPDASDAGGVSDVVGVVDLDRDFIARLSLAINSHLDNEEYFPDGLSRDMCLSTSQLGRKLKAMTGSTLSAFVMDVRLNRAKILLSKGGRSVKEVAFACGFSDMGYFSRSFKNAFDCSPSQFMKGDTK